MIASIDVEALLELAWVAPLSAIVVSLVFSFAVLGAARAADASRAGSTGLAVVYAVVAVVGTLAFAGVAITGILVIVTG